MVNKCLGSHCFCKMLSTGIFYCCRCGEHENKGIRKVNKIVKKHCNK